MFDIGGWEFLVIVVVALVVIGPKDLPAAVRAVSAWVGKARELAREFRGGLDELQREVELDKIEKDVKGSIGAEEFRQSANTIRSEIDEAGRRIERDAKDPWEESYSYFEKQPELPAPDLPADDVEAQARRALELAEAEESAAAADASAAKDRPAVAPPSSAEQPAPAVPPAGAGSRSGG